MAVEAKRGCGYRKVDGLYLVGSFIAIPCDRLPYQLESCPVCGAGIHFTRSMTEINPLKLFGNHKECNDFVVCPTCQPEDTIAYIMMVGEKHYPTPQIFLDEAHKLGISKRIPFIPKRLEMGKTWVFLAHNKACVVQEAPLLKFAMEAAGVETQTKLLEVPKETKALGIFACFRPQRIEKIVNESELTREVKADLEKRGITPVAVPDNDTNHH